jgi:hypothetical protein
MSWNAWTRAWYLVGEHAAVDLRAQHTVECKLCHQIYDGYGHSTTQGHNICAESRRVKPGRWMIVCGYGSCFDMHELWYLRYFPDEPVDGICDWCILRMLRAGIIMDAGVCL